MSETPASEGNSAASHDKGLGNLKAQFGIGIGLGILVMVGVILFADAGDVLKGARDIAPRFLVVACALSLVNYVVRFTKWHFYLGTLGLKVPLGESILTFLSGLSMSVTPGKLGELVKAGILKISRDIPVSRTTPVVIAERATDAFGLLVLLALGSISLDLGRALPLLLGAASIAFVYIVQRRDWVEALLRRLETVTRLQRAIPAVRTFYEASYQLFRPGPLVLAIVLSAMSWGLEGIAFFVILRGIGAPLALGTSVFIFAASTLLGAVSMLPGGLGAADGSLLALLLAQGLKRGAAGSAAVVIRLCTLWFAVVVGLIGLAIAFRTGLLSGKAAQTGEAQG